MAKALLEKAAPCTSETRRAIPTREIARIPPVLWGVWATTMRRQLKTFFLGGLYTARARAQPFGQKHHLPTPPLPFRKRGGYPSPERRVGGASHCVGAQEPRHRMSHVSNWASISLTHTPPPPATTKSPGWLFGAVGLEMHWIASQLVGAGICQAIVCFRRRALLAVRGL
jgi:hypothetical protein